MRALRTVALAVVAAALFSTQDAVTCGPFDELPYAAPHSRRIFVFHPRLWTRDACNGALALARRWQ